MVWFTIHGTVPEPVTMGVFGAGNGWPDLLVATIMAGLALQGAWGRSLGSQAAVADRLVVDWANGLPGSDEIYIVSLLGEKPGGKSEFSFYSFFEQKLFFKSGLIRISAIGHSTLLITPRQTLNRYRPKSWRRSQPT